MSTAIDGYLFYNGYDRDLWSRKPTEIDGVATQEISIAFVMSTQLAKAKRKYKFRKNQYTKNCRNRGCT